MRRVTHVQLAVTIALLSGVFVLRLTQLPRQSPFELFLLLNIVTVVLFRPAAAVVSAVGGLLAAHALMALEGTVPTRYATMTALYVVLSGILLLLNHRWHQAKDRAEADRVAHAEQRERLLEEAQHANKAKDRLLANVSHELRTPLNAITGWAVMMTRSGATPEHVRKAAEVIKRNAAALAAVVDQLLDVSVAVGGRLRVAATPVSIGATVTAAVETMLPEAAANEVTIHCAMPHDAGTIAGDEKRLQQVLLIALSNAVKFTGPRGSVTVSATTADGFVTIEICDTGIGIAADYLPNVFDRFSQADTSTTRPYGGIGLGLAIAKDLLAMMGSTITVSSPGPAQGTTVSMRCPLLPQAAARAEAIT